jgi:hypothetical protein
MAPLSWKHHTLLQALLSRGPLPEPDFHALFTAVSGKNPGIRPARFSPPPTDWIWIRPSSIYS